MLLNESGKRVVISNWKQAKEVDDDILDYLFFVLEHKRKSRFEGGRW